MEQGNPWVLMQPAELVIVLGAGLGIVLVSNSRALIWKKIRGTFAAFRPAARNSHFRARPFTPRQHGGSWKVAYADFVTALMCLFIVLWLTDSNRTVRARSPDIFMIRAAMSRS